MGIESPTGIKPDFDAVRKGVPFIGHAYARRISFSEVPNDEEGSANFIHKLFQEKVIIIMLLT